MLKNVLLRPKWNAYSHSNILRCFSDKAVDANVKQAPEQSGSDGKSDSIRMSHAPTSLEKKMLVWTKRFKNEGEIPPTVSMDTMEKSKSKARIKIANYMMLATAVACFFVAWSGKNAAARGESVQRMNLEWHEQNKKDN